MVALSLPLSDIEVASIGLAGNWKEIPSWLLASLERLCKTTPAGLLDAAKQNAQIGLLSDVLERSGLIKLLTPEAQRDLATNLALSQVIQSVLWSSMHEIDLVFSEMGIETTYLK